MKLMFKTKKFWYILLFSILFAIVSFSSFFHAISFFGLANNSWMAIILAFAFEIGQAAVLFSLLTSQKDRTRIMPWVLMTMFTIVQVIGNVFSSYKYVIINSINDLRYFKEPIFIWTQLPDDQATVIIVYIVGAILPLCSLMLTSMITNYLTDEEELRNKKINVIIDETEKDNNENKEEINEKVNDDIVLPEEEIVGEKVEDPIEEEPENTPEVEEIKEDIEDEVPHDKNGKIIGTDSDGGVIGEQGEDGLKVLTESLNSKDNEIKKIKQELEELKHPKMVQIPVNEIIHSQPMEEPEGLKQLKRETNEEEVHNESEESESTEIEPKVETEIKEKQNEVIEEPVKETPKSHFINLS